MANTDRQGAAALAISVPTALALALSYLKGQKNGEAVFPDEVVQLICAIAATSEEIKTSVQAILDALPTDGNGGIIQGGWPPNANSITALRVAINPANGVQMPSIYIPSGMTLAIKAWALNAAWLWVGASIAEARNINQAFPLLPNEIVTYQVENADQIYIAAMTPVGLPTGGCFACLTVEQRRAGGG